jgi:hypothetical protein
MRAGLVHAINNKRMKKGMKETGLVIFDEAAISKVDALIQTAETVHDISSEIKKCFTIAEIRKGLEQFFTPKIMADYVIPLMNTSGGFRTDRDPKQINRKTNKPNEPYSMEEARGCVIDALIDGVGITGNQFNIISSRHYITKEGFEAKLNKMKDLQYTIIPGIPKIMTGGAIVDMEITWCKAGGKEQKKTLPICAKLADGQGADVAVGKAMRKSRAWLFTKVTGREIGDADVEDDTKTINIKAEVITESKAQDLFNGGDK